MPQVHVTLLWVPALAMILVTNAIAAIARQPLGKLRWALATFVLLAPATFPALGSYTPRTWGVTDTVLTTMAIVSAARLAALDRLVSSTPPSRGQLFFWMTVPVARFWPDEKEARSRNRQRAPRLLLSALAKRLAWEPLAYFTTLFEGSAVPWPVRSAVLILYFVLNIIAAADALMAVCLFLGCDVDDLFDAPLFAFSPRDFWSRRWNKFISRFALKHVALPLGKKWGGWGVILGVFLTSGAFHEYFAWGVGGAGARYGYMSLFFLIQGGIVWVGASFRWPRLPHPASTALTFAWMTLTSPLFFAAIEPALRAFGFPADWLPFPELVAAFEGQQAG